MGVKIINIEEVKVLKRYRVLNTIGLEARFLVGIILALGLLLDWIGVLHFKHEGTWIMETMIFWGLVGMYCVICICGIYIPYYRMQRPGWRTLVEKALEEYKRKYLTDEMSTAMVGNMILAVGKNKGYEVIYEAGPLAKKLDRWDSDLLIRPTRRAAEVKHDLNIVAIALGVKLPENRELVFITAAVPMLILATMFVCNYII